MGNRVWEPLKSCKNHDEKQEINLINFFFQGELHSAPVCARAWHCMYIEYIYVQFLSFFYILTFYLDDRHKKDTQAAGEQFCSGCFLNKTSIKSAIEGRLFFLIGIRVDPSYPRAWYGMLTWFPLASWLQIQVLGRFFHHVKKRSYTKMKKSISIFFRNKKLTMVSCYRL